MPDYRMDPMGEPQVFLVEPNADLRRALAWILESAGIPHLVGADLREVLARAPQPPRGCLVVDLDSAGIGGVELLDCLAPYRSGLAVILITRAVEPPAAVRGLRWGVVDFLEPPLASAALLQRVHEALWRVAERRRAEDSRREIQARLDRLTPREREVLPLLVQAQSHREVADHLKISAKTADIHRHHILTKLAAADGRDLVRLALLVGLIPIDACGVSEPRPAPLEPLAAPR